jgi:glycine/D-amino acid oxidase-like deaminating enzyme
MKEDIQNKIGADVVVIGGGPAGIGAALAASRKGLNVCLLESGDLVGGIMATCPGMPIGAAYPNGSSIGGILDEFLNRLYRMNPPAAEKRNCRLAEFGPEVFYDHEIAILTLFQMLQEAGVNFLLNATALTPVLDNEKVTGVVYYDKNGQHTVSARVVIDCSGDGYIAARAGVPFEKGDQTRGHMMAVSLTFFMVNVEAEKIEEYDDPYFVKYAQKGIAAGRLHEDLHLNCRPMHLCGSGRLCLCAGDVDLHGPGPGRRNRGGQVASRQTADSKYKLRGACTRTQGGRCQRLKRKLLKGGCVLPGCTLGR